MFGRIGWWNDQSPARISTGMYVKFPDYLKAKRPDLLPMAVNVVVSESPFPDLSGIAALLGGA
jgi:hypothetical protein